MHKDSKGFVYYLYVPTAYTTSQKYSLIVALHWSTGRGMDMIERWKEPAEKYGYIIVCPDSANSNYWDIKVEDACLLRMIEEVTRDYSIDKKRIFVTGFSAGGTYALYLGLTYADIFAASAPFAGSLKWLIKEAGVRPDKVRKQIPFCFVHGTNDITVDIKESYFGQQELLKYGFKAVVKEASGLDHQYPAYISWTIAQWFNRQHIE